MYEDPLDQPENTPIEPTPPMPLGKVALINFGIMFVYMLLTATIDHSGSEAGLAGLIMDAMLLTFQVAINILGGVILLFTSQKHIGRAMLLSGLLVGIIGFGACIGKASMY
jgi:hypothetical protein